MFLWGLVVSVSERKERERKRERDRDRKIEIEREWESERENERGRERERMREGERENALFWPWYREPEPHLKLIPFIKSKCLFPIQSELSVFPYQRINRYYQIICPKLSKMLVIRVFLLNAYHPLSIYSANSFTSFTLLSQLINNTSYFKLLKKEKACEFSN